MMVTAIKAVTIIKDILLSIRIILQFVRNSLFYLVFR